MAITVRNNWSGKSIPFQAKIIFHPGVTILSKPEQLDFFKIPANRENFEKYLKKHVPGTRMPIFEIEAGSFDFDEPKKSKVKGKGKNKNSDPVNESPLKDQNEEDAVAIVEGMLDVESLNTIIETETRTAVIEKAKEKLDLVRS